MSIQTAVSRVFNFSAGPAVLPVSVLQQIQEEMLCLPGVGSSILEISHRSPEFIEIMNDARRRLAQMLTIPADYEILFLQGGARLQNVMVPMNLLNDRRQTADYVITGSWGKTSAEEVHHFGNLHVAWDGAGGRYHRLPTPDELNFSPVAKYVHMTSNETIQGVQFASDLQVHAPLVCDSSSDFLSRPIDIAKYGVVYACAKNVGIAGVTIVIIRRDLLPTTNRLPGYLNYAEHAKAESMFNTPPTFAVYVAGLVCQWLQNEVGGLEDMQRMNRDKSRFLYEVIDDNAQFYSGHAAVADRSLMNIVFKTPDEQTDKRFLTEAEKHGLTNLKGHRSVGGIRASVYNAMPMEGVKSLADFMSDFAQKTG